MRIGLHMPLIGEQPVSLAIPYAASLGIRAVEFGCGGTSGKSHIDPAALLEDAAGLKTLRGLLGYYSVKITALTVYGNPLHPDEDRARTIWEDYRGAVRLAEALGVDTIAVHAGCPGDCAGAERPNWVSSPWQDDGPSILDFQWNERLLPYWREAAAFAGDCGVSRIAVEMRPGTCVYNPETLLRLRGEIGDAVGAGFDTGKLFAQGIDPAAAARELGDAIYNAHASDIYTDKANMAVNGFYDVKSFASEAWRSWNPCVAGYGHSGEVWRGIMRALYACGTETVCIAHDDPHISPREGIEKAAEFLGRCVIFDSAE